MIIHSFFVDIDFVIMILDNLSFVALFRVG